MKRIGLYISTLVLATALFSCEKENIVQNDTNISREIIDSQSNSMRVIGNSCNTPSTSNDDESKNGIGGGLAGRNKNGSSATEGDNITDPNNDDYSTRKPTKNKK